MLAKLVNNQAANWEQKLADAILCYRISVSAATGHSPYYLMYGHQPRVPLSQCLTAKTNHFGYRLDDLAEPLHKASSITEETHHYNHERLARHANACDIRVDDPVMVLGQVRMPLTSRWDPPICCYSQAWHNLLSSASERKLHRDKLRLADPNITWDEIFPRPRHQRCAPVLAAPVPEPADTDVQADTPLADADTTEAATPPPPV